MKRVKKIILFSIIFILLIYSFLSLRTTQNKNTNIETIDEYIKIENEAKELININSVSEEFMNEFFEETSQLTIEENDNTLIVIAKDLKETYGATKVINAPNQNYFLVYDTEEEKNNALKKLQNDSDIISVEKNEILYDEEIEIYNENISTYNSWGIEKLGYDEAINAVYSTMQNNPQKINEVTIGILDSGLNLDLFNQNYQNRIVGCYNSAYDNNQCQDTDATSHGTHIAGTIAESTPDNVKLYIIRKKDNNGVNYTTYALNAIYYAITQTDIDIISFSAGNYVDSDQGTNYPSFAVAVASIKEAGKIFVASAGNDNNELTHYPSSIDGAISVSAIDSNFEKANFSNYGKDITFAAPGYRINSINGLKNGTSMSVPHVTSAVAILRSFNNNLTYEEVITLLKKYAIDIDDNGWDEKYGYGVVNFKGANFCIDDINCDEYGVFKNDGIDTFTTIKIEPLNKYVTEYNYGSITNIANASLKLYYTENDYYIKTLSQLIENIEILNYDPYLLEEQEVTIKYQNLTTKMIVDNSSTKDGWEYTILDDGTLELTKMNYNINNDTSSTYSVTEIPQIIYIPDKILINNEYKEIKSLGDELFKDKSALFKNNIKRIFISSGIENIGENTFSMSYENYVASTNARTNFHLYPFELIIPDSVKSIGTNAFKVNLQNSTINNDKIVVYTNKNSTAHQYAENNDLEYMYVDDVYIESFNSEYTAFEEVPQLSIKVKYNGSLNTITSQVINNYHVNYDNNTISNVEESIDEYTIKYNNDNDSFRYGDNSFAIEFDTSLGYHINKEFNVTVNKAVPEYIVPIDLEANIGQKLSDIILPTGFEWVNPNEVITKEGSQSFKAKYTPLDTQNYNTVTNIDINILVIDPRQIIEPNIVISDKTYDGTSQIPVDNIIISNLEKKDFNIEDVYSSNINVGIGTATVKIKLSDEKFANYKFNNGEQTKEFTINFNIIPLKLEKPSLKEIKYIYNEIEQTVEINNFQQDKMNISGNKRTNAGEQNVIISLKSNNYIWIDDTSNDVILKFEIEKADPIYEIPTDLTAETSQKLLEIKLPNNFFWINEDEEIKEYGNKIFKAKYIPDDTNNYNEIDNIDISIKVNNRIYTITFNSNNGKGTMDSQTFYYNTSVDLANVNFTKEGYKFKEWNTNSNGTGISFKNNVTISYEKIKNLNTKNITLYAQWIPIEYEIKFDSNKGTGTMENQIFNYETKKSLNLNNFIRANYEFIGWNTSSDGTGTPYIDGQVVEKLTTNDGTTIILYAMWKSNFDYVINDYEEDTNNNFISLISDNTSQEDYKNKFDLSENCRIELDLGDKSVIYTGSKTKIFKGDQLIKEFINIVNGDVTKDGIINIADVIKIADHTINQNTLVNDYDITASDVTGDGIINIADVIKIADYTIDESINLWR